MTTYDFYENTYLGNKIEETAFSQAVARAEDYVAMLERQYRVKPALAESRDMAVCAVAEVLAEAGGPVEITAASVGSVSVHYMQKNLATQIRQAVAPYLRIYRGVD